VLEVPEVPEVLGVLVLEVPKVLVLVPSAGGDPPASSPATLAEGGES